MSGLKPATFARSKGLPPWKIYGALQRRAGKVRRRPLREVAHKSALLPVKVVDEAATASRTSPLELVLAGGHRLLIPADFDARTLRRLIEVLTAC